MVTKNQIKNERGQMTIEMVLLVVIFMGVTLAVSKAFKDNELIAQMVSGPWIRIDGMIQNGDWKSAAESAPYHPNNLSRHVTQSNDEP